MAPHHRPAPLPGSRHPRARRRPGAAAAAVLAAVVAVLGVLVATATPAAAHASVVTTSPGDGQSVPEAPAEFSVTFTEPVDIELGGLTVLDRDGDRVEDGETTAEDGGRVLRVPLEADLEQGTYVGTWRVVSVDGHPISGSVLFAVGTAVDPSGLSGLTARTEPAWEVAGAVARFVAFTGALLAAGLAFFLAFLHDQRRDRWRLVPVLRTAAVVSFLGWLGILAAQAALATGRGLDAVTDVDVVRTVLTDTLGWAAVVVLVGLALVHLSTNTNRLLVAQGLAFYGWLAVSASFVLWGHATEAPYRWISVLSDGAHAAAAALWLGGLVGLALVLRRRSGALTSLDDGPPADARAAGGPAPPEGEAGAAEPSTAARPGAPGAGSTTTATSTSARPDVEEGVATTSPRRTLVSSTAVVVQRFSTTAAISVAVLVVAGVAMTFIQADGSLSSLWSTTYGRLVLAKVGLAVVVIALAAYNRRRLVPAIVASLEPTDGDEDEDDGRGVGPRAGEGTATAPGRPDDAARAWGLLRRSLVAEVAVLVAALAVTAVVVNVTPARTAEATAGRTVERSAATPDGSVTLTVDPARAGTNTLRVQYRDAAGEPVDVANSLKVELTLPEQGLGPISREVVKSGPGSFVLQGSELSLPGSWQVTLVARPSDFRELRTPFTVDIR